MRYLLGGYSGDGAPGLAMAGARGLAHAAARNPSWAVVGSGGVAYTVVEAEPGGARAWRLGAAPEPLGPQRATGGDNPCHAVVDPTGRWLLVANYGHGSGGGSVAVLPIEEDGSLGATARVVPLEGSGPDADRQSGPHAHQVVCRDGRVLVVDLGADRVLAFDVDAHGRLHAVGAGALPPGFGPRHLAFVGGVCAVAGELAGAVALGIWDRDTGAFALRSIVDLPDGGVGEYDMPDTGQGASSPRIYPAAVVPDPARGLVYVTVRGSDVVAVIDPVAEALLRTVPCGAAWPRAAVLDEDGSLLVACQHSGEVRRVDPSGEAAPAVVWRHPDVACVVPVSSPV